MRQITVPYGRQFIDNEDSKTVISALKKNLITTGDFVKKFEEEIKKIVKSKYALSCSSGTAGLHLAIKAGGLKTGDKVIVPIINFVATTNILKEQGLKIYYADVDEVTGQVTPEKIKDCIKLNKLKNIKAIFTMYLGGIPYNLNEFYKLKKKLNCLIIEDACHAFGSAYKIDKKLFKVGSAKHSDMCIFSFHPLKTITTGEGGMLTTNKKFFFDRANLCRSHGIKRSSSHWKYDVVVNGLNYRLSDINCALGISQLKKIRIFLKKRKKLAKLYCKYFSKFKNIKVVDNYNDLSCWHLFRIKINFKKIKISKNELFNFFLNKKIMLQQHYIPLFKFTNYKSIKSKNYPEAKKYFNSVISLPIYFSLSYKNQLKIIKILKKILDN